MVQHPGAYPDDHPGTSVQISPLLPTSSDFVSESSANVLSSFSWSVRWSILSTMGLLRFSSTWHILKKPKQSDGRSRHLATPIYSWRSEYLHWYYKPPLTWYPSPRPAFSDPLECSLDDPFAPQSVFRDSRVPGTFWKVTLNSLLSVTVSFVITNLFGLVVRILGQNPGVLEVVGEMFQLLRIPPALHHLTHSETLIIIWKNSPVWTPTSLVALFCVNNYCENSEI